ncbi:MAG: FAD-dependent oxidoreductase [Gemmatimonadota bacterium]
MVLGTDHIVIATGSEPRLPSVRGLGDVTVWTNREATTLAEIPGRAALIGGGPVGIELGQMLARFGSEVTIVQAAESLIDREDPRVGELIRDALESDGIDVRLGRRPKEARRDGSGVRLELDDGSTIAADDVVIGAGRSPRVQGIGLEQVGFAAPGRGLPVDDRCRLAEGLWAVGDVTGVMLFTHVAKYQGRIAAANILGRPARADYRSVPRVVFSDPEIATAGLTQARARETGIDAVAAEVTWPPRLPARRRTSGIHAVTSASSPTAAGASSSGPGRSLRSRASGSTRRARAIRAEIPLETLRDTVAQFPTYSEAYLTGLERLDI